MSDFPFRGDAAALRAWLDKHNFGREVLQDYNADALMGLSREDIFGELTPKHGLRLWGLLETAKKTGSGGGSAPSVSFSSQQEISSVAQPSGEPQFELKFPSKRSLPSPSEASRPNKWSSYIKDMACLQGVNFPMHPAWGGDMSAHSLPTILVSSAFRAFLLSQAEERIDEDMPELAEDLMRAVSTPGNEERISGSVFSALKETLQEDLLAKTCFHPKRYAANGQMRASLSVPFESPKLSENDPSRFVLTFLFEHKVGSGEGIKQCAIDFSHTVLREYVTSPNSHWLVPVHDELVREGCVFPVLGCVIEEQTLKFEALHLSPKGVVSEPLACCNLRPGLCAHTVRELCIVLTAARRCLERLAVISDKYDRWMQQKSEGRSFRRESRMNTGQGEQNNCVLPDFEVLALCDELDSCDTINVEHVIARPRSHVFRCCPDAHENVSKLVKISHRQLLTSLSKQEMLLNKRRQCWEALHGMGLAPKLERLEVLGAWTLTVAEWLVHPWRTLDEVLWDLSKTNASQTSLKNEVLAAVHRMHERDIVHGDLRKNNIMVREENGTWLVKFIDLEWLGLDKEAHYPSLLNIKTVTRPAGAFPNGIITKEHDLQQIEIEFSL